MEAEFVKLNAISSCKRNTEGLGLVFTVRLRNSKFDRAATILNAIAEVYVYSNSQPGIRYYIGAARGEGLVVVLPQRFVEYSMTFEPLERGVDFN